MQSKELNITYFDKNHSSDFIEIRLNEKEKYAINKTDLAKLEHKINLKIDETKITWNNLPSEELLKKFHKIGLCKLCLLEKVLHKESHIIPRFLIRENLKNEKGKLTPISISTKSNSINELGQISSNGYSEHNILCIECESKIGYYEDYIAKIIYTNPSLRISPIKTEVHFTNIKATGIQFRNVDKGKLKLFLLSIIWRCSISKIPDFKNVTLGSYQNQIREMIFTQKENEPHIFPFMTLNTKENSNWTNDILLPPLREKLKNGSYYKMIFGYFIFIVNISLNDVNFMFKEHDDIVTIYDLPKHINTYDFYKKPILGELLLSFI
jgi:hypothetical protein